MNQTCLVLRSSTIKGALRLRPVGRHASSNGNPGDQGSVRDSKTRSQPREGQQVQLEFGVKRRIESKLPMAGEKQNRPVASLVNGQPAHRSLDSVVAHYAKIMLEPSCESSQCDHEHRLSQLTQELEVAFRQSHHPLVLGAISTQVIHPTSPRFATRQIVITLIRHGSFSGAMSVLAAAARYEIPITLRDLEHMLHTLKAHTVSSTKPKAPSNLHLARYLVSITQRALDSHPLQPDDLRDNLRKCLSSLIYIFHHLNAYPDAIAIQELAKAQAVRLSSTSYILILESLFQTHTAFPYDGTIATTPLTPSLERILAQMRLDNIQLSVEIKALLVRRLGQVILMGGHYSASENLSVREACQQLVGKIVGMSEVRDVVEKSEDSAPRLLATCVHPTLLFAWSELLLDQKELELESHLECLERVVPQTAAASEEWSLELAIRLITSRDWHFPAPEDSSSLPERTKFLMERYMAEVKRAEILSRHALLRNRFSRAFQHLSKMHQVSRRMQRSVTDSPPANKAELAHCRAVLERARSSAASRIAAAQQRIFNKVRIQRRYGWIPMSLKVSGILPIQNGPRSPFAPMWHSFLHLSRVALNKHTLLASGFHILRGIFSDKGAFVKSSSETQEVFERRRRWFMKIGRNIYSREDLVSDTFLALIDQALRESGRSMHKADGLGGERRLAVFRKRLGTNMEFLLALGVPIPETLLKDYRTKMRPYVLRAGAGLDQVVLESIRKWRGDQSCSTPATHSVTSPPSAPP